MPIVESLIISLIVAIVISAITIALSELLRPKPKFENARPAKLGDFSFPTAMEGRVIPILWGRIKVTGPNVVWYGDLRQKSIKKKLPTGLFSSKHIITGFRYFIGIQFAFCRGVADGLTKIWIGDRVVSTVALTGEDSTLINQPKLFGGNTDMGSGGVVGTFRFHPGTETQVANTYLDGLLGTVPGYRGTCYAVFEGGEVGKSTSMKPWAFEMHRFPNQLAIASGHHIVGTDDANPMALVYEILTDSDWGLGLDPLEIDAPNFRTAAETLWTENNGMSLILDSAIEAGEMLKEIERQIDGIIYLDQRTGLYRVKLARGDYDIDTVPQLGSSNVLGVKDFTRGTWEATSNQVRVEFADRNHDYATTYAQAHDLANMRIQQGEMVAVQLNFPGVKARSLAANLASRELRLLSTPLAKAKIVVDRSMWELTPLDVIAWTDAKLGFVKLPMRVNRIDLGSLLDGKIELDLMQDVFTFAQAFDGDPDPTGWVNPTQGVVAVPAAEQVIIEAPKAFTDRDDGITDRLWAGARLKAGESFDNIYERHAVGTPAGSYRKVGIISEFLLVGELNAILSAGTANPHSTIQLVSSFDTVADMFAAFTQAPSAGDIGRNLVNLIYVDGEFMGVTTATDQTTRVDLGGVYRGLLDTAPKTHASGTKVYLVMAGGSLTDETIPAGDNVDAILRPESRDSELAEGSATVISLTMNNRGRRPYPPAMLKLNTVAFGTPVDIDAGSGLDNLGVILAFIRRDFRTADEVASLLTDAATLDPTFPAANTTEYRVTVINDPLGTPVTLYSTGWVSAATILARRTTILRFMDGVIPTTLRFQVWARHTFESVVRESLVPLQWDTTITTSTLANDFFLGVLSQNEVSAVWTTPTAGTYNFTIGTALPSGAVEARVNGGAFAPIITATNTTGSLVIATPGDTIEVRHTQAGGTTETFLGIDAPSSALDAFAILIP